MSDPQAPPAVPGRWWHVVAGLVGGIVLATIVGVVLLAAYDVDDSEDLPLWTIAPLQLGLWGGLVAAPVLAARQAGRSVVDAFGLRATPRDAAVGFSLGIVAQLVAVPLLYLPLVLIFDDLDVSDAAESLTDRASGVGDRLLLVLVVAVGAPLVEELFYRGLLQGLLLRRFAPPVAIALSSVVFAATHFQLVPFPALVLFGALAGWLAHHYGRLGPAIWAHVGFNATTVVILLL